MGDQIAPVPLWVPSSERVQASAMAAFRTRIAERYAHPLPDTEALHQWSIAHHDEFWSEVFAAAVRHGERGAGPVAPATDRPPGVAYFPTARVSYAQELLAGGQYPNARREALIYRREDGHREAVSWAQLRREVAHTAAAFVAAGVGPGSCVAAWLPNIPAAVIAMLAANAVGAVYTSASPDFGAAALADRFAQVSPTVLVVADGYRYNSKEHPRLDLLGEVLGLLPSVSTVFVVPELATAAQVGRACDEFDAPPGVTVALWPPAVDPMSVIGEVSESTTEPLEFTPTATADPGFVLYSSGTTGQPKCIVHSGLGLLLKHWTEHVLHSDIRPGDTVFFFTTCGWMMWNWLVGSLAVGATVVLYDGFPLASHGDVLWQVAAAEQVTFFGASAKYFDSCRALGLRPGAEHDLVALRTVASTGSPLAPADFVYIYDHVAADIHLASISGGTDICGCFVLGDPTRPVFAGEIQGPALGVAVDVIDAHGTSLRAAGGVRGELVCRNTIPSMPLYFAGDDDGQRYRAAYFEAHPGLWTHGDFAYWTDHGGIVITGRSDATLNAGGVRIGTAEIYRHVEAIDGVLEALAVGQEFRGDTRVVLFVRLRPGVELNDQLRAEITRRLRTQASPRHVPAVILPATDFPRTRSGKLAELAVADIINGRVVRNTHALANPACLASFAELAELAD